MHQLFFANIPCDCQDAELQRWVEAQQGFDVDSVRVVRDLVAGVSPAFGYISLRGATDAADAIKVLDGRNLNGRKLRVKKDWRHERNRG